MPFRMGWIFNSRGFFRKIGRRTWGLSLLFRQELEETEGLSPCAPDVAIGGGLGIVGANPCVRPRVGSSSTARVKYPGGQTHGSAPTISVSWF